jgi:hypothetical protein
MSERNKGKSKFNKQRDAARKTGATFFHAASNKKPTKKGKK